MLNPSKQAVADGIDLLGELHPLLEQLGTADGLFCIHDASASLRLKNVTDKASLKLFLETYREQILLPLELPTIHRAHGFACHNGCRELLALDESVPLQAVLKDFLPASRRVGQSWLKRLRPLRGERLVQRYLAAVESGRAQGWHTLVYGITLAMYSLPVRQGLHSYARQTLRGFLSAAAQPLHLTKEDSVELFNNACDQLHQHLDKHLSHASLSAR